MLSFTQVASDDAYEIKSEILSKAKLLGTVSISKHESVDVGTMYLGDHREGKVSLRNDTDQPIEITGMSTSCGCTAAYPVENKLDPGQSVFLIVRVKPTAPGKIDSRLGIKTSDDNSRFDFRIRGELHSLVTVNNTHLKLGKDDAELTITVGINHPELTPEDISVQREGHVRLASRFVYGTIKDEFTFRLFVSGDISSLPESGQAKLNEHTVNVRLQKFPDTNTAVLHCVASGDIAGDGISARLTLADQSFEFQLHSRAQ